jgi:simple sugar transport system permease protein
MIFMLVFAGMSLKLRADQIVTGMAMNLIAAGLTSTAFDALGASHGNAALSVPELKGILSAWNEVPVLGSILFRQTVLTWLALLAVPLLWLYFEKTERGLELRAVGENPEAAQAAGVSVIRARLKACLACGALSGLGGAFLTVSQTSSFAPNCTSGRGFVALAIVVLGRHGAFGTAAAALFFGAAFFMRDAITISSTAVELVEILPYVLTLAALCWKFKSRSAPAALGKAW